MTASDFAAALLAALASYRSLPAQPAAVREWVEEAVKVGLLTKEEAEEIEKKALQILQKSRDPQLPRNVTWLQLAAASAAGREVIT